jgi:hypothetical protein
MSLLNLNKGGYMLTSKQKVFKRIMLKYIDQLSKATDLFSHDDRHKATRQAEENKRLHLLALNQIM